MAVTVKQLDRVLAEPERTGSRAGAESGDRTGGAVDSHHRAGRGRSGRPDPQTAPGQRTDRPRQHLATQQVTIRLTSRSSTVEGRTLNRPAPRPARRRRPSQLTVDVRSPAGAAARFAAEVTKSDYQLGDDGLASDTPCRIFAHLWSS